jgi:magnesium-transporting ATPase (P-type)
MDKRLSLGRILEKCSAYRSPLDRVVATQGSDASRGLTLLEALTIFIIVLLNAILGYTQEQRAEQAVAALQAMSAATARVLRDGSAQTIATAEVVPGDILLIQEGNSIAADARVLETIGLRAEEATLTGESVPIAKSSAAIEQEVALADQRNMVWSGTTAAAGGLSSQQRESRPRSGGSPERSRSVAFWSSMPAIS